MKQERLTAIIEREDDGFDDEKADIRAAPAQGHRDLHERDGDENHEDPDQSSATGTPRRVVG